MRLPGHYVLLCLRALCVSLRSPRLRLAGVPGSTGAKGSERVPMAGCRAGWGCRQVCVAVQAVRE